MDFLGMLESRIMNGNINKEHYYYGIKNRAHISKSKIIKNGMSNNIDINEIWTLDYNQMSGIRYMFCESLSYPIFISVYDVNKRSLCTANLFKPDSSVINYLSKILSKMNSVQSKSSPSLEGRIFGMQNDQNTALLIDIIRLFASNNISLVEADLFGNELRNIAIDAHVGMSFNLLPLDRVYRPGELNYSKTMIQFEYDNRDRLKYIKDLLK
ncbi:MAG: hypothetical protein M1385_01995 [Candidatus Marsarchaeota archaeon]|nr:hypothetical protein [Candidatus Marsarchaeota archaeon]